MSMTEITAADVAERVRPYIERVRVGDVTVHLVEKGIYLVHGYWRIPIRPSAEPEPLFPYFEALANLEQELQDETGLKVSLSSGEPLTED